MTSKKTNNKNQFITIMRKKQVMGEFIKSDLTFSNIINIKVIMKQVNGMKSPSN